MNPQLLFGVQFTLSLIIFVMVSRWYISPALGRMPIRAALVPLFLIHALRYLPSSAFAPGQVDPKIPMDTMASIAYGDLISALLALIAVVFLHYEWQGAIAVAWVVNALTSLDWLYGGYLAASSKIVTYWTGGNWYIINYYVPVIAVVHVMIFARLLTPDPSTGTRSVGNKWRLSMSAKGSPSRKNIQEDF
jgi:hypothetical protein